MSHKNKPIGGSIYIIIGAAMMLMSVLIDPTKLIFFILTGAIFIVVGFFKIIIKLEEGKKEGTKKTVHHSTHQTTRQVHMTTTANHTNHMRTAGQQAHTTQQKQNTHNHTTEKKEHENIHVHHKQVIRCSNCHVKVHPLFKYCPNCGQKLG